MKFDRSDVFNNIEYSQANHLYRDISDSVFEFYMKELFEFIHPKKIKRILDIGCGTGQFALKVSKLLPTAEITALDSSATQLQILDRLLISDSCNNVKTCLSSFESYSSKEKFDLLICSEAIHLVEDLSLFAQKIDDLLSNDGVLCIRTPSPAQYAARTIYNFFPHCRYNNLLHCKGPELIEAAFSLYDLHILKVVEIDESNTIPSDILIDMFQKKSFSTLHIIPEKEYADGVEKLKMLAKENKEYYYNFNMTEYIIGRSNPSL